MQKVTFGELCALFLVKAEKELREIFETQDARYAPDGWFLAVNQMFDSSKFGHKFLLPYGPNNTHKVVPTQPFSVDGLASGTVCATHYMPKEELNHDSGKQQGQA